MASVTCADSTTTPTPLPIDGLLGPLLEACKPGATVLLQAPPGAGKTTRVPLALLEPPAGSEELFPHIYGPLALDAVVAAKPLTALRQAA